MIAAPTLAEHAIYADWPLVAPDGYFHQHAVRHLIEIDDFTNLQRLIDRTHEDGGNAWFEAAEVADNLDGYLEAILADSAPMRESVTQFNVFKLENWKSLDYLDDRKIGWIAVSPNQVERPETDDILNAIT